MNIGKFVIKSINTMQQATKAVQKSSASAANLDKTKCNKTLNGLTGLAEQNSIKVNRAKPLKAAILEQIEHLKEIADKIIEEDFTFKNGEKLAFSVFEGTKAGSNKGFFVQNKKTGELFYAKFGNKSQIEEELLASRIYKLAGLSVPQMQFVQNSKGEIGLISKYIPNLKPVQRPNHTITEGFGMDALLANWDAVISNNAQTDGQKLFRIDFGGALNHRAQGEKKNFNIVVDEITTLLNPEINPESATLFSKMTQNDLEQALLKVVSLDETALKKLIKDDNTRNILLKRKEFLGYVLELIKKTPKKDNQTMLKYLENIKKSVLTTPLTEFETYRLKHPEIEESKGIKKLSDQIKTKFNHKTKDYRPVANIMLEQRNTLNTNTSKALKDSGYPTIEEELRCIKNSFGDMNRAIRCGDKDDIDALHLDAVLKKLSIPQNIALYRGATPHDFGGLCSNINTDKFLNKFYKKGRYFTIPIFPNTTFDKNIAETYLKCGIKRFLFKINTPEGTPGVYMEKLKGSTIDANEEEVLLARDMIYRFKNRIPYFTYDEIEVDIINKLPEKCRVHNFSKEVQKIKDRGLWDKFFQ